MEDRMGRGVEAFASQLQLEPGEVRPWLVERFGERFAEEALTAAGGAWTDDALSLRDRSLVVIAALIAQGGVEERLRDHVRWAVEHGSSRDELEALAALLAMYVGYPRAAAGAAVVRSMLDEIGA